MQDGLLFPFIYISRRATQQLLQRRLQLSLAIGGADAPWPFCEAFAPTEVAAAGMTLARLEDLVDARRVESKWPVHASAAPALSDGVAHPMLEGHAYIRKLLAAHEIRTVSEYESKRGLLEPLRLLEDPDLVLQALGRLKQ